MKEIIGYCGIDCAKCKAYMATIEDSDEIRKEYAKEQSERFGVEVDYKTINCDGCLSMGEHLGYCSICEIRKCGIEKKVENCAFCNEYICEKLDKVYTFMRDVIGKRIGDEAEAKVALDEIRNNILKNSDR